MYSAWREEGPKSVSNYSVVSTVREGALQLQAKVVLYPFAAVILTP